MVTLVSTQPSTHTYIDTQPPTHTDTQPPTHTTTNTQKHQHTTYISTPDFGSKNFILLIQINQLYQRDAKLDPHHLTSFQHLSG